MYILLIFWVIVVYLAVRNEWVFTNIQEVGKGKDVDNRKLYLLMTISFWVWNVDKMKDFVKFKL